MSVRLLGLRSNAPLNGGGMDTFSTDTWKRSNATPSRKNIGRELGKYSEITEYSGSTAADRRRRRFMRARGRRHFVDRDGLWRMLTFRRRFT